MATENSLASMALDALESNLNDLLIYTGSVFGDAAICDDWTIVRPNLQTKQAFPKALSNFQDALDCLEREIVRARAIMLRDYGNYKAREPAPSLIPSHVKAASSKAQDMMEDSMIVDSGSVVLPSIENNDLDSRSSLTSLKTIPAASTTTVPAVANKIAIATSAARPAPPVAAMSSSKVAPNPAGDDIKAKAAPSRPEKFQKKNASTDLQASSSSPKKASTGTGTKAEEAEEHELPNKDIKPQTTGEPVVEEVADNSNSQNANEPSAAELNSLLPGFELYATSTGADTFEGLGSLDEFSNGNFGMDMMDQLTNSKEQQQQSATGQDPFDAADFTDSMFEDMNNRDTGSLDDFLSGNFDIGGQGSLDDDQFDDTFFNIPN